MDINSMGSSPVVTAYAATAITSAGPVRPDTQPKGSTEQSQPVRQQGGDKVSLSAEAAKLSTMSKTVDSSGESQSGGGEGDTSRQPPNPAQAQMPSGQGSLSIFA